MTTEEHAPQNTFAILFKKKLEGFWIFLAIVCTSVIWSFIVPPKYTATEILRLARVNNYLIENVESLNNIFQNSNELDRLAAELHTTPQKTQKRFTLRTLGLNPNLMIITGYGTTPQEAIQSINVIRKNIIARQQRLYEPARAQFDNTIRKIEQEKIDTKNRIIQYGTTITRLQNDIRFYQAEIATRGSAQSNAQGRIIESYIKLLADTKNHQDTITQKIIDAQQHLLDLETKKQDMLVNLAYNFTQPTVEIQARAPGKSTLPPDLIKNIIYAIVLGIFLAIIWVLIRTYHIGMRRNNAPTR